MIEIKEETCTMNIDIFILLSCNRKMPPKVVLWWEDELKKKTVGNDKKGCIMFLYGGDTLLHTISIIISIIL